MTQARDLGDAANKANFLDNVSSDINTSLTNNATAAANAVLPAGVIIPFGGTTAPSGYLACGGQTVARSSYVSLFAAIGTAWNTGGENSATFRLPDLRGAFLRGTGNSGVANMANGNDFAGPAVGSFEADQMQGHKHTYLNPNVLQVQAGTSGLHHGGNNSATATTSATVTDGTNGTPRVGDETRPFNAGILYCIKT